MNGKARQGRLGRAVSGLAWRVGYGRSGMARHGRDGKEWNGPAGEETTKERKMEMIERKNENDGGAVMLECCESCIFHLRRQGKCQRSMFPITSLNSICAEFRLQPGERKPLKRLTTKRKKKYISHGICMTPELRALLSYTAKKSGVTMSDVCRSAFRKLASGWDYADIVVDKVYLPTGNSTLNINYDRPLPFADRNETRRLIAAYCVSFDFQKEVVNMG